MGNYYGPDRLDETCEDCGTRLTRDPDEPCEECGGEEPEAAECETCDGTGTATYCDSCRHLEESIASSD